MARHRAHWWLPLALPALALGACSGTGAHSPSSHARAGSPVASPSFPVTLRAADGAVRIARPPVRIISLSPTATEDLFAVGAGPQVVAVDSYSTYPPQAPRTQLSGFQPNVEAIARYRPDLVVVAEDDHDIVGSLGKLGVPVLVEPPASGLAAAYGEIDQLGQATGHAAAAASLVARMQREIAGIAASVPRPRKPLRVYHELEPTFYSATSHTFVGQIYALLGLQNIADAAHVSGPYPQLSAEYIVASDPDLIVLSDTACCRQSAATVAARPGWRNIAAVKDGAVIGVEEAIASHWGPRIVDFARIVAQELRRLQARG